MNPVQMRPCAEKRQSRTPKAQWNEVGVQGG
jgi:hypothetical protein